MNPMKLTEFLAENMDSHDLVGLDVFKEAGKVVDNATFVETPERGWQITTDDGKQVTVRGRSVGEINRSMSVERVGPKGLMLAPDADLSAVATPAWVLMSTLARGLTGASPGDQFMGRGTAFRADLKAIREAGY
jgi:hypothetical protein